MTRLLLVALLMVGCRSPRSAVGQPRPVPAPLADARQLDSTLSVELRYGTADNFTGAKLPGYDANRLWLVAPAARALVEVQADLRARGLGLRVYDAYRPVRATREMVAWARRVDKWYLFQQGYIASHSKHNLGNTVDLTLIRLTDGRPLDMGTPYDTFSADAHTANATGEAAANRKILLDAMAAHGFRNYDQEWWHFTLPMASLKPLDVPIR